MRTSRLRVTLREVTPMVLRVIDVPTSSTLPELHDVLQVALGWTDSHLHAFVADGVRYGVPDGDSVLDNDGGVLDDDGGLDERDEAEVRVRDLPARFAYLYDFGDGWCHDIEVLAPGGDRPGCRYGEGACPPEDCGGPGGYAELREVLADPTHHDHDQMRQWAGELADFDRETTDLLVTATVGEVPPSVRLVLDLLADGVTLTPRGRLPRIVVRRIQELRPGWACATAGPAWIEDDLPPLATLHEVLRRVGLVRLAHGVLRPTRAAGEDVEVVRRLRSWFTPDGFTTYLAGDAVAMLVAAGPLRVEELTARVYPLLDGWARDGQPLTEHDVRICLGGLCAELQGLDQIEAHWPIWSAGAAARSLLPRATALAHLWTTGRHKINT